MGLHYVDRAIPGKPPKGKEIAIEEKNEKTNYDEAIGKKSKPRGFSEKWKKGQDWLQLNSNKNVMTCTMK